MSPLALYGFNLFLPREWVCFICT